MGNGTNEVLMADQTATLIRREEVAEGTLSHLLIQSLSMRCGYPASSIRERVYADAESQHFGILLYTGSPDAEGTLGGLVQQGRLRCFCQQDRTY